ADLFAGTPPGASVHPDYPVVRAPRGFLVSYSLPPVAIALGRRALDLVIRSLVGRLSRGVTRIADSEVVQMAIGEAEAMRARRDMVYAQHQVGWALERLCELSGARWLYDADPLQEIRRDVIAILTHHAASRQAAFASYGQMLLGRDAE